MKKAVLFTTKSGFNFMCKGGAVVEWLAVDLGDTGSHPPVGVSTVFNR